MDEQNGRGTQTQYEIRVAGVVSTQWCDWFDGLTISLGSEGAEQKPVSTLHLTSRDPSVLHGVLAAIGSLNLTLLSVRRLAAEDDPFSQ